MTFQVALAALATPLEFARAAGEPRVPHVEAAGSDDCAPPHDEAHCRICQTVTVRDSVPATGAPTIDHRGLTRLPGPQSDRRGPAGLPPHGRSRAPPRPVT
jgi:hypothetical protein